MNLNHKVIFIIGPTASGKSQLAIELAEKFGGVIINCDSIQFYKGLEVGSAAPSKSDCLKVPHYLYSIVNAPEEISAGDFVRHFYNLINESEFQKINKNKPLILVGGTGFYIQALEKGMYNIPEISNDIKLSIEKFISEGGAAEAYLELIEFDPLSKIHPNDHYRIGRALEIKRTFNLKMSDLKSFSLELNDNKNKLPFSFMKLGIEAEKEEIHQKVKIRSHQIIQSGIIDEVSHFMELGYQDWAPLNSVGFLETKNYLQGQIKFENLSDIISQSTMKLVKKQKTWFKRDPEICWVRYENFMKFDHLEKISHFLKN